MSNNPHHFKFTKKDKILKISKNRKGEKMEQRKKHSELLMHILNSSESYKDSINYQKTQREDNNLKKALNHRTELKIENKRKNSKSKIVRIFNNIPSNSKIKIINSKENKVLNKNKNIIERIRTEGNIKDTKKSRKINESKENIKHNLNIKINNKFSILKMNIINNIINNRDTFHSRENKNKMNSKSHKKHPKHVKKIRDVKNYGLNKNGNLNKSYKDSAIDNKRRKYPKIFKSLIISKTEEIFFNKNLKLNSNNVLKNKNMEKSNLESLNSNETNDLINRTEINHSGRLNKPKYINLKFNKNFIKNPGPFTERKKFIINNYLKKNLCLIQSGESNTASKEDVIENKLDKKFNLLKNYINSIDSRKKNILILKDEFQKNKSYKFNTIDFPSEPKSLIDKIRAIKKLSKL